MPEENIERKIWVTPTIEVIPIQGSPTAMFEDQSGIAHS